MRDQLQRCGNRTQGRGPCGGRCGNRDRRGRGAAHDGIVVEGLEAAAWTVSDPGSDVLGPGLAPEHGPTDADGTADAFEAHHATGHKEYKIIWSRDKMFEGKFDVARLEETLNQFARQGWVVKAMSNPHLKDFGGGTKEEVVVLLER